VLGGIRFLLDVLRNAFHWDLGPLNALVAFSFLNFSVIVFVVCVVLMIVVSKWSTTAASERTADLTVKWGAEPAEGAVSRSLTKDVMWTVLVGGTILGMWIHFR
jgi:hypothetical protein